LIILILKKIELIINRSKKDIATTIIFFISIDFKIIKYNKTNKTNDNEIIPAFNFIKKTIIARTPEIIRKIKLLFFIERHKKNIWSQSQTIIKSYVKI
jgi:hypothetical protein